MNTLDTTHEAARLRALRLYRILDTSAEKTFDDLARLASIICGTPMSAITLIDEKRQWLKSRVGLSATETAREVAFCHHTIENGGTLVVEDATADARFASNPLVLAEPSIRFYAGAPLVVTGGHALGALCVIDREPRRLRSDQLQALEVLRDAVVGQLELRRALADLNDVERLLPMCAWCRHVRVAGGEWKSLREFIEEAAPVTHGLCPSCAAGIDAGSGA
jgi:GAF domain-containing protein